MGEKDGKNLFVGFLGFAGIVPRSWLYDEDTGTVMCRCPECGGRLTIGFYTYHNPYQYCPYCGEQLTEGRIAEKRAEVYGKDTERK